METLRRLYRNSLEILQRLDRLDRDSIETVQRDSSEIPQRVYRYSCRDSTDTLQRHHTDSTEAPQTHRDSKDALQTLCRDFTKRERESSETISEFEIAFCITLTGRNF